MDRRPALHKILEEIITPHINDRATHVFFQPHSSIVLKYPCILYKLSRYESDYADNLPYMITKRYSITVIDRNPDSKIPDKIARLPMCSFERHYQSDNLNHWVFELYY